MAVRESAADYTGHRTADARRRRALALVLFALDVIEELRRLLLVVVIEDVRDGEGGDRGELLAGFGVSPRSTYTSARSSRWKMFCGFSATAFSRYVWASPQLPLSRKPPPNSAFAKNFWKPESRFTSACHAPTR